MNTASAAKHRDDAPEQSPVSKMQHLLTQEEYVEALTLERIAMSLERRARWRMRACNRVWEASGYTDEKSMTFLAVGAGTLEREAKRLFAQLDALIIDCATSSVR